LLAYQSGGNLFDTVKGNLHFTAYISEDKKLPEKLLNFKKEIVPLLKEYTAKSDNRFSSEFLEPEANGGEVAQQIARDFGFQPMAVGLFDPNRFYFHLTLRKDDQIVQIPLGNLEKEDFRMALESGIKRFASGFTKSVAMVLPASDPQMARFGMGGPQFMQLEQILNADLNVKREDLTDGAVDSDADVLLLVAPKELDEKQLFAVDQFLMRGGTVIAATSPFSASFNRNSLSMQRYKSGLEKWLSHHGLTVEEKLVLDPQNSAFPIPVLRQAGGFQFRELRMIDYPYFADIRSDGLNRENSISSSLNQLTMAWASPIVVDGSKNAKRNITELLYSSDKSWLSSSVNVMPQITQPGVSSFHPEGEQKRQLMGVISQGRFDSYFADKESPLLASEAPEKTEEEGGDVQPENTIISSVIKHSPESGRIILFASNDFLRDQVTQLLSSSIGSQYLGGLELAANALDWSLEEQELLSIRSRGHFNRTLPPMEQDAQLFWESINYLMAIVMLGMLALLHRYRQRQRNRNYSESLAV